MIARRSWFIAFVAAIALLAPASSDAQGQWFGRVQDALEVTDRRIELAEALVPPGDGSLAVSELALAKQVQVRARSAFDASQYGIAERATLEARAHADRAIAIVRRLPDPDRVLVQVERTGELADRARERLADCTETRARALMQVGEEMQARAVTAVGQSRYLAALQLTMSARERIFKAMRLCNITESLAEHAARALQRTDEVLARAREALENEPTENTRRALERATALQLEAQGEYRAARFEAALRLTHASRLVVKQVLGTGQGAGRRGAR